ncbi:MAG: NAD-dependent epimerase/dehydratase family protein [Thiogranum sp.]
MTYLANNCCVSGASGFVGRALCSFLQARDCRVTALIRKPAEGPWDDSIITELGHDGLSPALFAGFDAVFHAAGLAHVFSVKKNADALYQTVNVQGSVVLARAAAKAGVGSFVYFSSVKAMGDPGEHCVDESWHVPPGDLYGVSKREAEARVLQIGSDSGMRATVLRPALVYGPGVKGNLQRMMVAVAKRRFPPVPEVGNRRSMVHVDDLAEAAWLAATLSGAANRIYIVSDGRHYSTHEIFKWMSEAFGREMPSWALPVPLMRAGAVLGDVLERGIGLRLPLNSGVLRRLLGSACYRSDRIRRELGWQSHHHFREALPAMIAASRIR